MFQAQGKILVILINVLLLFCCIKAEFSFLHEDLEHDLTTYSQETNTRNSDEVYRLPENVIPIEYNVYIDLYFAEKVENPFSFDGRVEIIIEALEENVTQIVLHANVDRVRAITLLEDSRPVPLNLENGGFFVEPQYHFLKIDVLNPLKVKVNHTLIVTYSNTMNDGPLKRGIWKGWYRDADGNERIYAATHFQPYNARQAFPCWDEPLFKSVFTLHLSHPTTHRGVFSNTPIRTHTFSTDILAIKKNIENIYIFFINTNKEQNVKILVTEPYYLALVSGKLAMEQVYIVAVSFDSNTNLFQRLLFLSVSYVSAQSIDHVERLWYEVKKYGEQTKDDDNYFSQGEKELDLQRNPNRMGKKRPRTQVDSSKSAENEDLLKELLRENSMFKQKCSWCQLG